MVLARVPRARALALAALAPEGASSSRTDAARTPAPSFKVAVKARVARARRSGLHRGQWTFAFSQRRERTASDVLKQNDCSQTLALVDGSLAHTSSLTQADGRRNKGPKSGVAVLSGSTRVISVTPQTDVPPKPVKVLFAEDEDLDGRVECLSCHR
jgi:hypothetical protein